MIFAIIRDTFRELLVRKVLVGFLILNVLILAGLAIFMSSSTVEMMAQARKLPISDDAKLQMVYTLQSLVALMFFSLMIFVNVFATASVVPTMLEKGTIDLYLSKPISRGTLLLGKVLGSVLVVAGNIAVFMVGSWVILSMKLGVWNPEYLAAGAVMLFSFTVLYSIVVVFNVMTRSSAVGIIVTYAHVMILSGLLANREMIYTATGSELLRTVLSVLYFILPQSSEHSTIAHAIITHAAVASWTPMWGSALIGAGLYALAAWMFSRKEF